MRVAKIIILLIIGLSCVYAQNTTAPPTLQGRWDDTVCNLITNSAQYYQRRSYLFGAYSTTNGYGTLEITTQYFPGDCSASAEEFRTVLTGTYHFPGNQTVGLEGFWDVNYRLNTKNLEVFSNSAASVIDNYNDCDIKNIITNTLLNVRHSNCIPLHLLPIEKCPIIFDTVRRDESTLWIGNQFPGEPPVWQSPCSTSSRPEIYDTYSLALYDPYFGAGVQSSVEEFLNFDDGVTTNDQIDYLDNIFHTSQIVVASAPSIFNRSSFLCLLFLISFLLY